jgi:hypothetical protein
LSATFLGGAFVLVDHTTISEACKGEEGLFPADRALTLRGGVEHVFGWRESGAQCERCGLSYAAWCAAKPPGHVWGCEWVSAVDRARSTAPPIEPGDTRPRCAFCTWPFDRGQEAVRRCLRCGSDLWGYLGFPR